MRSLKYSGLGLLVLLTMLTGAGSVSRLPHDLRLPSAGHLDAMLSRSGELGVVTRRTGALSLAQKVRAVARRDQLPVAERWHLDAVLAAASPDTQGYVAEAFAAGHSMAEVTAFAAVIAGRSRRWLSSRLNPVDPAASGPVLFRANLLSQYDATTCGSTAIVVARVLVDPLYALWLTTGGRPGTAEESDQRFSTRLRTEERRVHDETGLLWPQLAGTPPWGVTERLNRDPAGLGAHYRWIPTVGDIPLLNTAVLRRAFAAAGQGYPVPFLIGDVIPRHYVLLVRHDARGALFYEPTKGEVVVVSAAEIVRRDFRKLGRPRLMGVALPSA
ncbi:hypothetical protein [Actinoplanes sp. TFC3]|uniref:hypothetical protein n=1 Tax=Actinoplanes sp. TFC3 TaxID=1710355 RepID=UPI00082A62E8|nr:hypothetical protein [Actinoplanes sp. TFC3]